MTSLLVADMGEILVLRYGHAGGFVVRHRRAGALLSGDSVYEPGTLMWRLDAIDRTLGDLLLPTLEGEWLPVGLYNPLTCEVAFSALPGTRAFGCRDDLIFDTPMLPARIVPGGMLVGAELLDELQPSLGRAEKVFIAR